MAIELRDKVIIITGASAGIGAATAVECAKAGMDVVLNARRGDRLEEVAQHVRDLGRRAVYIAGDVTDEGMSQRLIDMAREHYGRFDVVFANAGYGFEKSMLRVSDIELRQIFDTNFFAAFDLIALAGRIMMREQRPGHLLMCSSCIAKFPLPYYAAYSATKAAQSHLCAGMRVELAPHGIRVSSVHPVTTRTEFFEVAATKSGKHANETTIPEHSPRMFIQPPQRVARAIVRCLRRPRPEVWTSTITRFASALVTFSPRLGDMIMRRVTSVHRRDDHAAASAEAAEQHSPR